MRGLSAEQREGADLVLLADLRPGAEGLTGHAVVRQGSTIVDPSSGKTYASMEEYLAQNPQYAEAGRLRGADAKMIFDAPPCSPERQRALDEAKVPQGLRSMLVADKRKPTVGERSVPKVSPERQGKTTYERFVDSNGQPYEKQRRRRS